MKPISRLEDKRMDIQAALGQEKVLAALDTISVKLIKSEAEREALRRELDATKATAHALERSMLSTTESLGETSTRLDNALRDLDLSKARQERLDEKLRDAAESMNQLSRKLEAEEKRRMRLYRRLERLETTAKMAQEALEAKAMVLLTDRTLAVDSGRPMLNALDDEAEDDTIGYNPIQTVYEPVFVQAPANDYAATQHVPAAAPAPSLLANRFSFSWLLIALAALLLLVLGWQAATLIKINPKLPPAYPNAAVVDEAKLAPQPPVAAPAPKAELLGADPELPAAYKSLEESALTENSPAAQHDLAALYVSGHNGVKKNYERAKKLFELASEGGIANAAYNLGVMAHQGLGEAQNTQKAYGWYLTAALKEHPEALYNLGIARIEGKTTAYNPQLAAWYFAHAALNGVGEAAYNLGLILENGLLGEQRSDLALEWYKLGQDLGHKASSTQLEELAVKNGITTDSVASLKDQLNTVQAAEGDHKPAVSDRVLRQFPEMGRFLLDRDQVVVLEIQNTLTEKKLYTGAVDGLRTPALQQAISRFQHQNGQPQTGAADMKFLTELTQSF